MGVAWWIWLAVCRTRRQHRQWLQKLVQLNHHTASCIWTFISISVSLFSFIFVFSHLSSLYLSSCVAGVLQCQSVPGCHVDGGWSQWGAWTDCSLPCGGGVKFRRRQCDNPSPQSGGRGCLGVSEQQKDCNIHLCTGSLVWPIELRTSVFRFKQNWEKKSSLSFTFFYFIFLPCENKRCFHPSL